MAAWNRPPGDEYVWCGWADSIALLGLRRFTPLVRRAERHKKFDAMLYDREYFEEMLTGAEQAPSDKSRFEKLGVDYINDVLAALTPDPEDEEHELNLDNIGWDTEDEEPVAQPVINPMRHVGRNDACPCGSGKKAKRCLPRGLRNDDASPRDIWLAAGVRTPFAKVDGPLAAFDAIELSVPVARHMAGLLKGGKPDFAVWGVVGALAHLQQHRARGADGCRHRRHGARLLDGDGLLDQHDRRHRGGRHDRWRMPIISRWWAASTA